jgi:hypothetical protein
VRYLLGIPVATGLDLLQRALASVAELAGETVLLDNTEAGLDGLAPGVEVVRPIVPLTFTQSMNALCRLAEERDRDVLLFMHHDAEAQAGTPRALLDTCHELTAEGRRWGVAFTHYDAFAALNLEAVRDVGPWDTALPHYFADNDYYRRVRLAGWELVDTGLPVAHHTSSALSREPRRRFLNHVTFPLAARYYAAKWGGPPGEERFDRPFGGTMPEAGTRASAR